MNIKEITADQFKTTSVLSETIAYANGRFYCDISKTSYPSKRNEIGLSAYPMGRGSSIFLPKDSRFFSVDHVEGNPCLKWMAQEVKNKFLKD